MHDVLVFGGDVIGLSLAWDLARHRQHVRVIDRAQPGRESSWVGAEMLPPANRATAVHAAVVMSELLRVEQPQIDLATFRVGR